MRIIVVAVIVILVVTSSVFATSGGFSLGLGLAMPRGQFNRYARDSFTLLGAGKVNLQGMSALGAFLAVQGIFLENRQHDVNLGGWHFTEDYSTSLTKFAIGAELTPIHGIFVPYVGAGLGLYYFSNTVSLKDPAGEEIDSKRLSSELDFGWSLNGGIRLFVVPNIAIDLRMNYDKITGMESLKIEGDFEDPILESESTDSEFLTITGGVHFQVP